MKPILPGQIRLESAGMAGEAREPIGLMASSMAHDLNNILQIISGNLALLAMEASGDASLRRINNSLAAAKSGAEITGSVLDYCRQRSGGPAAAHRVSAQDIDEMKSLLEDAVGVGVEVSMSVVPGAWLFRASVNGLRNAMINLAVNARDAMDGRGRLRIDVRNVTCPLRGEHVWLSVADDGPGMPPEILERVFAPLFTTKQTGTGLGLAIVAEFARSSGADVAIDSRPGLGTCVTFEFPRDGGSDD